MLCAAHSGRVKYSVFKILVFKKSGRYSILLFVMLRIKLTTFLCYIMAVACPSASYVLWRLQHFLTYTDVFFQNRMCEWLKHKCHNQHAFLNTKWRCSAALATKRNAGGGSGPYMHVFANKNPNAMHETIKLPQLQSATDSTCHLFLFFQFNKPPVTDRIDAPAVDPRSIQE